MNDEMRSAGMNAFEGYALGRLSEVAPISWTVCGLGSYVWASSVCMLAS